MVRAWFVGGPLHLQCREIDVPFSRVAVAVHSKPVIQGLIRHEHGQVKPQAVSMFQTKYYHRTEYYTPYSTEVLYVFQP